MEVLQIVFETVDNDKKDWNTEIRTCKTESCRNPVARQIYMHQGLAMW